MRTCSRTARITVSSRQDGIYDVSIASDCENVMNYAEKLKTISETDVYDVRNSKIYSPDALPMLTSTCLVPVGIMDAASKEMGLLTNTICKSAKMDEIVLFEEEEQ